MKKLTIVTLLTIGLFTLSLEITSAQVLTRANTSLSTSKLYPTSGSIKGAVYVKKSAIPAGVSINQIASAVSQGLKAFEFVPQNTGLLSDQYIHVEKAKLLGNAASISVKSTPDKYVIEYAIHKLPLMKPMMVRLIGNAAKSIAFAVDPVLKNFPVAYLTACDTTFECYSFNGSFIPVIK